MTPKQIFKMFFFLFTCTLLTGLSAVNAQGLDLVDLLSSQLGISTNQASGGAGSIFQVAKQNMTTQDFASVADVVPGIDQMLDAAPEAGGGSGSLGRISSMLSGSSKKLGGVTGLTGSFEKLGLDAGMVNAFIPIILDYVKNQGGETIANLLKAALL